MNKKLLFKNYSSSLVDEHLLYLNNLYKLEVKLNYGDSNFYQVKSNTITLNPECPDILFSLYHEFYHARKQHESNSFQAQFQYLQEVAVLFFLICLRLCWFNPNQQKINSFQPLLHFNEYRADAFALKHLKRLPKTDWLLDLDASLTHPSTKSRLTLLQRLASGGSNA